MSYLTAGVDHLELYPDDQITEAGNRNYVVSSKALGISELEGGGQSEATITNNTAPDDGTTDPISECATIYPAAELATIHSTPESATNNSASESGGVALPTSARTSLSTIPDGTLQDHISTYIDYHGIRVYAPVRFPTYRPQFLGSHEALTSFDVKITAAHDILDRNGTQYHPTNEWATRYIISDPEGLKRAHVLDENWEVIVGNMWYDVNHAGEILVEDNPCRPVLLYENDKVAHFWYPSGCDVKAGGGDLSNPGAVMVSFNKETDMAVVRGPEND